MTSLFRRVAGNLRARFERTSPSPAEASYAARMREEIEHYRQVENVHDLPEIFHLWSHQYVRTKMEAAFNVSTFHDFYTKYMLKFAAENPGQRVEIASLGAGNGDVEIGLAKVLREKGFENFFFHCMDVNPNMLARGRVNAATAGLADKFAFEEADAAN